MNKIKKFFTINWRPKFICLGIAIVIWFGVRYGYIKQEDDTPKQFGDIIIATP